MAYPLELSYNWRTPTGISLVVLLVCTGLLANSRVTGWLSVVIALFALETGFLVVVWLRTRAYMRVDGPLLTVRRFHGFVTVDGRTVTAVTEFMTPNGPSYKLSTSTSTATGRQQPIAPTALLLTGHSTLFDWVLTWAPRATLDPGCLRTIDALRTRGLLE